MIKFSQVIMPEFFFNKLKLNFLNIPNYQVIKYNRKAKLNLFYAEGSI